MQIKLVDPSNPKDCRAFAQFPFALYRNDRQWVPPLLSGELTVLDPQKHPFYEHSQAAFFTAVDGGHVVGRIGVMDNRNYNAWHKSDTAFFNFFECIDDQVTASALVDAAANWARNRSLNRIIGPKGMTRADAMGLLISGHQEHMVVGRPYHPPYYKELIEGAGFTKEIDYMSGNVLYEQGFDPRYIELGDRVQERRGFRVRSFKDIDDLRTAIPYIKRVFNEAFTGIWGYYPMTAAEIDMAANDLTTIAQPGLVKLVFKGDELAGFAMGFPDVSEGLRRAKGKLLPLGWYHLLHAKTHSQCITFQGVGMLPAYQGVGASALLYSEIAKTVLSSSFRLADFGQVAETNPRSLADMEAIGVRWNRIHRIYQMSISV